MNYRELASLIVQEVGGCLDKTREEEIEQAVSLVAAAKRVFLAGAGRSGLEVRSFAMRLTHIGLRAFCVGDVTTPAIGQEDLLVVCSGSGETLSMLNFAKIARKKGAKILLFTTRESSAIADLADSKVVIHAKAAKASDGDAVSIQPMSNLFVQALCLTLDIIIIRLMEKNAVDESLMKDNHANLE